MSNEPESETAGAEVDLAMGGQSQCHKKPTQRVWHQPSHQLKHSRSQTQKTFVGGKVFNPETDCPICRAKALNQMHPHWAHHDKCTEKPVNKKPQPAQLLMEMNESNSVQEQRLQNKAKHKKHTAPPKTTSLLPIMPHQPQLVVQPMPLPLVLPPFLLPPQSMFILPFNSVLPPMPQRVESSGGQQKWKKLFQLEMYCCHHMHFWSIQPNQKGRMPHDDNCPKWEKNTNKTWKKSS